jgi:peptidoglycan/xylan/chitin deacetylase (PgdA/CDA1 family)
VNARRARRAAPALVLMYHRVRDGARDDPFGLSVSPTNFAAHMAAIHDVARIVGLSELAEPADHPRIAVTFDDGYLDNREVAFPILAATATPATIFVATQVFDGREHWWNRLEHILGCVDAGDEAEAGTPGVPFLVANLPEVGALRIDLRTRAGRTRAVRALTHWLRPLPPAVRDATIDQVQVQLGARGIDGVCRRHAGLSEADVRHLASTGLVDIGGHTQHHPYLSGAPAALQRDEIFGCHRILRDVMGRRPTAFAYPFGDWRSYGIETLRAVRHAGFDLACTNEPGWVTVRSRRFELPRHHIHNWDGADFMRRLANWFGRPS